MRARCYARLIALGLLLAIAATACGVQLDVEPSPIASDQIPDSLRPGQLPTATVLGVPGAEQPIYMVVGDSLLIQVFRNIAAEPQVVLDELLVGPSIAESRLGIGSALNRSTSVVDLQLDPLFQLATVTLGPNSLTADSQEQMLAFGQMVFTLTELDGIENVIFLADLGGAQGITPVNVQTNRGSTLAGEAVGRNDYAAIDPGRDQIEIAFPDDEVETPEASPSPTTGPVEIVDVPIWVLDGDNQLIPVTRRVRRDNGAILQTLFDGLLTNEQGRLRSALPEDALARTVETVEIDSREFGVVTIAIVDLAEGSLPPLDDFDERALAVGQIVFTLTGLIEVDQVLLTIDGEPTSVPTQAGLSAAYDPNNPIGLRRADYSIYAPNVVVIDAPTPAPVPQQTVTPEPTPTPGS